MIRCGHRGVPRSSIRFIIVMYSYKCSVLGRSGLSREGVLGARDRGSGRDIFVARFR